MSEETNEEVQEETKVTRKTRAKADKPDGFPIKLKRNYRPAGDFHVQEGEQVREPGIADDGTVEREKMFAGAVIWVPVKEAMRAVELGIASRNDPFI